MARGFPSGEVFFNIYYDFASQPRANESEVKYIKVHPNPTYSQKFTNKNTPWLILTKRQSQKKKFYNIDI
jgi:hypothetical protein